MIRPVKLPPGLEPSPTNSRPRADGGCWLVIELDGGRVYLDDSGEPGPPAITPDGPSHAPSGGGANAGRRPTKASPEAKHPSRGNLAAPGERACRMR